MRKEYQAIVDKWREKERNFAGFDGISGAVAECEALADNKPPKMLTDEEILLQYVHQQGGEMPTKSDIAFARAIIEAHIAKQNEPETRKVKIGVYRRPNGQIVTATDDECVHADCVLIDSFEREVTI